MARIARPDPAHPRALSCRRKNERNADADDARGLATAARPWLQRSRVARGWARRRDFQPSDAPRRWLRPSGGPGNRRGRAHSRATEKANAVKRPPESDLV